MSGLKIKKNYYSIDLAKYFFACLIPILHVPLTNTISVDVLRQYFARLGVPFFFAATGFLLTRKMESKKNYLIFKKQFLRIGRLLLIWLLIYTVPAMLTDVSFRAAPIRTILFKTPAYLWYLSAVLFGLAPYCLIRNTTLKFVLAFMLYVFGTLFSESYAWMTGSISLYNELFLTYRNGLFFAFPMMCIGQLSYDSIIKQDGWNRKKYTASFIVSFALFSLEVTLARKHAGSSSDMSMTFMLPIVVYYLMCLLTGKDNQTKAFRPWMRNASTAIYVMQFAFIFAGRVMQKILGIGNYLWLFVYIAIVFVPTMLIIKKKDLSIIKYLI